MALVHNLQAFLLFYEDKLWICREDGNDGILSGSSLILCDETCQ
jgi:hypothetical protein